MDFDADPEKPTQEIIFIHQTLKRNLLATTGENRPFNQKENFLYLRGKVTSFLIRKVLYTCPKKSKFSKQNKFLIITKKKRKEKKIQTKTF